MKKVEVIIGQGTEQIGLDLESNAISIALQYSIDDVRNIDKKNSNYSKTITIPGTKKNNKAFGNLFDVNSTFDQFDINKKIDARIIVDSSPVLEGYLQLTKVNKFNTADLQGNKISYEVVVFDNSIDFIQTLGDKKVQDLDVSIYDHTYNQTVIENAWNNHTFLDMYQYPLMDKNIAGYETTDFRPAFYHKALLLKIAQESGYTLEGSFMSNTTYEREIIAWDGNTPKITDADAELREYKAGFTGGITTLFSNVSKSNFKNIRDKIQEQVANPNDISPPDFFDNTGTFVFNQGPASDPYARWTAVNAGKYNFKIVLKVSFTYSGNGIQRSKSGVIINNFSNALTFNARLRRSSSPTNYIAGGSQKIGQLESLDQYNFTTKTITSDVEINIPNVDLAAGEDVYLHFGFTSQSSNFAWTEYPSVNQNVQMSGRIFDTTSTGVQSFWSNETVQVENVGDAGEIELGQYLPKDIKQKDILSDVIKRYNVYVRKHPTKNKTLILESRDDFYANNVSVLDWTQKKDYSSEDKIAFLSDLQNKEILFTYKEANDLMSPDGQKYNELYNSSTGDIYGQKLISFDNDFVKGVKRIESIFSTAPLVYRGPIGNSVVVPTLDSAESKRNPVLLYWGGLKPVLDEFSSPTTYNITWGTDPVTAYTTYPYAGHWDDPYTPTLDIHYGQITYEFYGELLNNTTDNNLFNNYWRNYINQIGTGKIVTSKFYLRETDINTIKDALNTRIFIKDSYYTINKIIDYKPLEDGLTTVELLYITQGSSFSPISGESNFALSPYNIYNSTNNLGPLLSNNSNNTSTNDVVMLGRRNYVGSNSNSNINGNDNIIGNDSTNINITGDGNTVEDGLTNVTIVGDNQIISESNTSYINGTTFTPGNPLSGLWEAGLGLDSVVQVNSSAANTASGYYSITTGVSNANDGNYSGILGGSSHTILAGSLGSSILGGASNNIAGDQNSIVGGSFNSVDTTFTSVGSSAIVAGSNNVVGSSGERSVILGGTINNITGSLSSIVAGSNNTLSGDSSIIVGGISNTLSGDNSVISGSDTSNITGNSNNVFGGLQNNITIPAQFNGVFGAQQSTISGPSNNNVIVGSTLATITNPSSGNIIVGGNNTVINFGSNTYTLAGTSNEITGGGGPGGVKSGIIGGELNTTNANNALILNSRTSDITNSSLAATGKQNLIVGGTDNTINVDTTSNSIILGGKNNIIDTTVDSSVILGGDGITATQDNTAYIPKLVVTETYIPTATSDTNGETGEISYDGSYVYVKTTSGWLRSTLSTF